MEVDLLLVGLGVNGPVLGLVADFLGAALEEDGGVSFGDEDEANDTEEGDHD